MNGVVSNASPLIVLAKADLLWILPRLFAPVFLPQAVRAEIETGEADDPMRKSLAVAHGWSRWSWCHRFPRYPNGNSDEANPR